MKTGDEMKKNKRSYQRKYYYKLILFMLLPTLFIYMVSFAYFIYSIEKSKADAVTYYEQSLSRIDETLNETFDEIRDLSSIMLFNPLARDYISYRQTKETRMHYNISEVHDFLLSYASANTIIESIAIYDASDSYVVSTQGTAEADLFFEDIMSYDQLTPDQILSQNLSAAHYVILSPDTVNRRDKVLPLITNQFGDLISDKRMIINLDYERLQELLDLYTFTPNSRILIRDDEGTTVIHSSYTDTSIDPSEVISITSETFLFNHVFQYEAIIPLDDLTDQYKDIRTIYIISSIVILLFTFSVLFFGSKKLYSPIENILEYVSSRSSEDKPMDELQLIDSSLHNLVDRNAELNEDLESSSHYAKMHYLYTLLQDNIFGRNEVIEDRLREIDLHFEEDYFCVLSMQYDFLRGFYEQFNDDEQKFLINGMLRLFKEFYEPYSTSVITLDKKNIAIILNLPQTFPVSDVRDTAQTILNLFQHDYDLIHLKIGIGGIYQYINGIHFSYVESKAALGRSKKRTDTVLMYEETKRPATYSFTYSMEHKLSNYIMSGNEKAVVNVMNKLLMNNRAEGINLKQFIMLYKAIAQLANRIATESPSVNANVSPIDIVIDPVTNQEFELHFEALTGYCQTLATEHIEISQRNDIGTIIDYIDHNFTRDLSLDFLADQFNYSSKYLSRMLNDHLDEGYKQYVSIKRVDYAKQLLKDSTKTIQEISELCGFNHRNSFVRTFKSIEGITPSQFRSLQSQ